MKRNIRNSAMIVIMILVVIMGSCKKNQNFDDEQIEEIEKFMVERGFDITPTESGLYYQDIVVGGGEQVNPLDTVEVIYTGYYLNGIQFDSNVGKEIFRFVVQDYVPAVIEGFDEALTYMREGGESIAIIPSWLGYGSRGSGAIPGYTPIFFQLKLVNIVGGPVPE
jgi:FKBP-type peptidyl-prolyl cis-trans isomerase FkpA